MRIFLFVCLMYFERAWCMLWSKGVVHYSINSKDYDLHSQDEIMATLTHLERELCVKFFNTPMNYSSNAKDKILYINNPDKRKICLPEQYDYSTNIVNMVIGYKCINQRDIARMVVDMLKSSIEQNDTPINSYDLIKTFDEKKYGTQNNLIAPSDRNYINAHYHKECGNLYSRPIVVGTRRSGDEANTKRLSEENEAYYNDKIWPLGVVMYTVDTDLRGTKAHTALKYAMTSVELKSCVVFQFHDLEVDEKVLMPKNMLIFSKDGEDVPYFGLKEGNQTIRLSSMVEGAPAHTAHILNLLLRVLGVPMMSNRFDRDNYVIIHWKNVMKGKEHLLEKTPEAAWLKFIPYDFDSVTHASANFACGVCDLGAVSVQPIQESLWQRTLSMGHKTVLSQSDVQMLKHIYGKECERRFMPISD